MNAKARTARQIIKARRVEAAAMKRSHTLASHALRAGVPSEHASGVAGALRTKGKQCGITGQAVRMFRTNAAGQKLWKSPVKNARRYSLAELHALAVTYSPRAAKYVAAREALLAYAA